MSARQIVASPRTALRATGPVDMEAFLAMVTRERRMRETPGPNYACVIFKRRHEIEKLYAQKRIAAIKKMSSTTTTSKTTKVAKSPLKKGELVSYANEELELLEPAKPEFNMKRIIFGDCKGVDVKLLVGPSQQEFHIEKWNLVYHSTLFQNLLHEQNDQRFGPLVVEEVDSDVFELFKTWTTTCKLPQLEDESLLTRSREEHEPIETIWNDLMSRTYIFAMKFGSRLLARDIYNAYAWILFRSRDADGEFDALLTKDTFFRLVEEAPHYPLSKLFAIEYMEHWSKTEEGRRAFLADCLSKTFLAKVNECYRKVQEKKAANGGVLPGTIVLPPRRRRSRTGASKTDRVVVSMEIREPEELTPKPTFVQQLWSSLSL